jgi:hypothetical protein
VEIYKQIVILVLYRVSFRLVTVLKLISAFTGVSDIFVLILSFKLDSFVFQISPLHCSSKFY